MDLIMVGHTYKIPVDRTDAKLEFRIPFKSGAGWGFGSHALPPGTLIRHESDGWGIGSDPGMEQSYLVLTGPYAGKRGEIRPCGIFGSSPQWLELADGESA